MIKLSMLKLFVKVVVMRFRASSKFVLKYFLFLRHRSFYKARKNRENYHLITGFCQCCHTKFTVLIANNGTIFFIIIKFVSTKKNIVLTPKNEDYNFRHFPVDLDLRANPRKVILLNSKQISPKGSSIFSVKCNRFWC